MDLKEFVSKGQETMTIRRAFGEPYVQNGVTVVPAARIRGAVGGAEEATTRPTPTRARVKGAAS